MYIVKHKVPTSKYDARAKSNISGWQLNFIFFFYKQIDFKLLSEQNGKKLNCNKCI